jgi:hypothetical protein
MRSNEIVEETHALRDDGYSYRRVARWLALPHYTTRYIVAFKRHSLLPSHQVEMAVTA